MSTFPQLEYRGEAFNFSLSNYKEPESCCIRIFQLTFFIFKIKTFPPSLKLYPQNHPLMINS